MPIPSPYNFVPLSDHVFLPDWAAQVSQDVPFSDGISGWFDIEVEATTPIYIRNGGDFPGETKEQRRARLENADWQDFFRVYAGGDYAIPGTSLKGMVRAVLEIATFGKMQCVDDHRYGVRDLHNHDLYGRHLTAIETRTNAFVSLARPGWLIQRGDQWSVTPCQVSRVEQTDLEAEARNKRKSNIYLGEAKGGKAQPASAKYKKWGENNLEIQFHPGPKEPQAHRDNKWLYYSLADLSKSTSKGTLVFTGQPADREKTWNKGKSAKHMEFVFYDPSASEFPESKRQSLDVSPQVRADFEFIHTDGKDPNAEWTFWSLKLRDGQPVPVFFLAEGNSVSALGLAQMFRLPYTHSVHETIRHTQPQFDDARLDFVEILFGRVHAKDALRGRVSFEHALALANAEGNLPTTMAIEQTVLGAPKPTFYPNYIRQSVESTATGRINGEYRTFMDADAEINGWKRYPAWTDATIPRPPRAPSPDVETRFRPLPRGTLFLGRVHVHNLRPLELGALFWALTWGGKTSHRHRLGMAKPYGFGHIAIRIVASQLESTGASSGPVPNQTALVELFMNMMNNHLGSPNAWEECPQICQLLAMSDPANAAGHDLRYPLLIMDRYPLVNEFREAKTHRQSLLPYSPAPVPPNLEPKLTVEVLAEITMEPEPIPAPAQSKHAIATPESLKGQVVEFTFTHFNKKDRPVFKHPDRGLPGYLQNPADDRRIARDRQPETPERLLVCGFTSGTFQLAFPKE